MKVLHNETECGNYRGMPLVARAGKIRFEVTAKKFGGFCDEARMLPEKRCEFQRYLLTNDMMFVVPQEMGRASKVPLHIDL